jgi:hypothetical protein
MNSHRWPGFVAPLVLTISLTASGAHAVEDHPATHNMLVVGTETAFLSHLPMFGGITKTGTDYTSPHRYQVILQATFHRLSVQRRDSGLDVTSAYTNDRKSNPGVKMYTLNPEDFVLSRVFTPVGEPALRSFKATLFRGHLERGGEPIRENPIMVHVEKVAYAKKFGPSDKGIQKLSYVLFGDEHGLFLAHMINKPPDFDQVLSVNITGHEFTPDELGAGIEISFSDRNNTARERLKPGQQPQQAKAEFLSPTRASPFELQVQPGIEYYFEEGELAMPPTFDQTEEEKKSGF